MSRTYGKAQDLIDFTRASNGTALRRVKYGAELVTNGTFNTDSDWSKQTGWSIGSGVASFSGGGGASILQNAGLESGKVYAITFDITSITSGGFIARCGFDNVSQTFSTTGTHTANLVCGSNAFIYISSVGVTAGTIDNVSVKEVTFDTSDGDLLLFNHPNNVPRIEYDASGNLLGLLVEESRTNLVTYSEDASQWPVVGAPTITTNIATAPDGAQTVDGIQDTSGDSFERVKAFSGAVSANSTVTGSIFIKKETSETNYGGLTLSFTGGSSQSFYGIIDAVNGTIVNPSSGLTASFTVTDAGDFWRMSITATDTGSNTALEFSVYGTLSSNGTSLGIGIGSVRRFWGAQVEQASFPTSYIPTSGSTATRSADVASIGVDGFGYRQDEGTVVVECQHFDPRTGTKIATAFGFGDGTTNNRIWYYQNKGQWIGADSGVSQFSMTGSEPTENTPTKFAGVFKENDFTAYIDGASIGTDNSGSVPLVPTLFIGYAGVANSELNGHIKSIKYYPRRLTNDQLVELTS